MEERIEHLESRLAFQDETLNQLNDVVARQDKEIEALKREIESLKQRFQEIGASAVRPEDQETPPPHY